MPDQTADAPADGAHDTPPWAQRGHLPCLDGLRALSILLVIFSHLGAKIAIFRNLDGHLGVTCFFVISGFLITLLLLRERARAGRVSLKAFYARRTLRIVPAYLFYLGCIAALQLRGRIHYPWQDWLAGATYMMSYRMDLKSSWCLVHTWSLSVEEHFYLLFPCLLVLRSPQKALRIVLIYIAATPILRYIIGKYLNQILSADYCSLTEMSSIATGCAMAFLVWGAGFPAVRRGLQSHGNHTAVLGALLLLLSLCAGRFARYHLAFEDPVDAVSFALIIAGLLYAPHSLAARLLNSRLLVVIGVLSYSLYLWQQPFTGPGLTLLAPWPWNLVGLICAAILSYYCIERPFLQIKARFSRRDRHQDPPPPVEFNPAQNTTMAS